MAIDTKKQIEVVKCDYNKKNQPLIVIKLWNVISMKGLLTFRSH